MGHRGLRFRPLMLQSLLGREPAAGERFGEGGGMGMHRKSDMEHENE